ncbi:hypothetical protein DRQ25_00330 [Candidatus Fermentibacteria bacterium]|nr:MAG: hypothetical protein DRQ25_00330 [Candidatus Fermentibacteria bacterium]
MRLTAKGTVCVLPDEVSRNNLEKRGFFNALKGVSKNYVELVEDAGWQGKRLHLISKEDVDNYYHTDWDMSGMREVGTLAGDWRPVDNLASFLKHVFEPEEED